MREVAAQWRRLADDAEARRKNPWPSFKSILP
jgi:hypothetical protein